MYVKKLQMVSPINQYINGKKIIISYEPEHYKTNKMTCVQSDQSSL